MQRTSYNAGTPSDYRAHPGVKIAPAMEKAIKPFQDNPPQWKMGRPVPEQDENEPVLEWEAHTKVQVTTPSGYGINIKLWGDDEVEDDWEEEERIVHEEEIEDENNPDNVVTVEVIDEIIFTDVDGIRRRYVLQNNSQG